MKEIILTQGKSAMVDDEDYRYLNQWKWYAHKRGGTFYAERNILTAKGHKILLMHRVINETPDNFVTDHIDGNGLNNQRHNLRAATTQQNSINSKIKSNNISGYRGIYWNKQAKKWRALIKLDGREHHIGYFYCLKKAIEAYKNTEQELMVNEFRRSSDNFKVMR